MTREELYEDYIINNMSKKELYNKYNLTEKKLRNLLEEYNIKKSDIYNIITKEYLIENYINKNKSLEEIAIENKICRDSISKLLKKYDIVKSNDLIREKIKTTNIEKYGVDNPTKNTDIKDKIKATNIEKYGTEWGLQSKDIREKSKETIIKKYGVDNVMKNKTIHEKAKKTNLEKYGIEYSFLNEDVKEKIKNTNIERYGHSYALSNKDIHKKTEELSTITIQQRYGVPYYCMTKECLSAIGSKGSNTQPNLHFADLLQKANISYEREFPILNRSYDFKVNNILMEINPTATHNSTFGICNSQPLSKEYHFNKSKLALDNNYRCIHIFDWEDENKIIYMLSNKTKIYARKCELKEVDVKDIDVFLNSYHLQNTCKGQDYCYGLYYNNMLVEVMTFGKPRYNNKYEYEILRLCTHKDYYVVGGAERLFNCFIKEKNPKTIISYCDNSKFTGEVYKRLGFKLKSYGVPSIHWYNMKTKKHITANLLKQRGFDGLFNTNYGKGTSNEDLMLENGFVKIYDCGQSTYIWRSAND